MFVIYFKIIFEKGVRSMDDGVDADDHLYVETQVLWYHVRDTNYSYSPLYSFAFLIRISWLYLHWSVSEPSILLQ